ncbi:MAG: hypothetical protein H6706_07110 [Myxococcales bacterium]|nr:hypothetical protein [Myxococcales bacterium]
MQTPGVKQASDTWRRLGVALVGGALTGCGPTPETLGGSAVLGAVAYALVSWAFVRASRRLWHRLRTGAWPQLQDGGGLGWLLASHAAISGAAALWLPLLTSDHHDVYPLLLGCAASHHLAWALVLARFTRLSPASASAIATVPTLITALGAALNVDGVDQVMIVQYLYGGFLGAAPGVILALLCLEATLRAEHR